MDGAGFCSLEFEGYLRAGESNGRFIVAAGRSEVETYTIDDEIRVPILLSDEDGVAHVRAIFRRLRTASEIGPRGLDPDDILELRGNGQGQKKATVEVSLKVADGHAPGEYLCTAIQAYDVHGNMEMIKTPPPRGSSTW